MDGDSDVPLSDEEPITAQKVLQSLEEAWLNEKFSPELLQHQSGLVDCMLEQIQQMEENVQKLKKDDFRVVVHRMELDRIRYIITSYLRTRLEKIELFTMHILEEESKRGHDDLYLSQGEDKYAREYLSLMEDHFMTLTLKYMPTNIQACDKTKMSIVPNLSSHIFLRAKQNIAGVLIEGDADNREEEIDLDQNSQHIMQYKSIAGLVKSGEVQLI